ncbi:MAG TPA: efflux RND transporter periplasmic adaptor subunit [Candidatus Binatia bacterium]|nr:efflux RND transporter periplasmic adaptor subunit [Candidatus Binatia bacterium]
MRHRGWGLTVVFALIAVILWGALGLPGVRRPLFPAARSVSVTRGSISQVVVATGRVEPVTEVILANKIPGRVRSVLVKEGDLVRVGQPVILFDDDEAKAQRRLAEARLATARADVRRAERAAEAARARWKEVKSEARPQEIERARAEVEQARRRSENAHRERDRARELFERGLIAQAQFEAAATEAAVRQAQVRAAEEALNLVLAGPRAETVAAAWAQVREAEAELQRVRAAVAQAEAELDHATALVKNTVVESTVDGRVTYKLVEPGAAVDIGIPLMILAAGDTVMVRAEVDETDAGKLDLGLPVEITADAYPGRVFRGRITEIGQSVGKRKIRPDSPVKIQDMKVLETKIEVEDGGGPLKLGMTVDVRVIVARRDRVPVIPAAVVPADARVATVRVLGARGLEERRARLGARDDAHVEVVDGLSVGERVLVPESPR